jgi:predicted regulator of Ras-like GTPase activity (Roadblock/LC7/MglB family)
MSDLHAGSRSERLDRAIHGLLAQTPEIEAAAVVSFDGLPMASALPPSMDEDRVAAMSAALLSLGERAAQGLGRGELSQVYIEGETGTVFLVSADNEAVLVAVAAQGAKVGMMLYEVRRAAAAVADALRADDEAAAAAPAAAPVPVQAPEPVLHAVPAPVEAPPAYSPQPWTSYAPSGSVMPDNPTWS